VKHYAWVTTTGSNCSSLEEETNHATKLGYFLQEAKTHSSDGEVASPMAKLVDPSSSETSQIILFLSPNQAALLISLELLKSHEEPFDKSKT
jgi:hypothetical protein